jgi:hypothetical protein
MNKRKIIITVDAAEENFGDQKYIKVQAIKLVEAIDDGDIADIGTCIDNLVHDDYKNPSHVQIIDILEYEDSRK